MKKISALVLLLSSILLTGCGGCPGSSEESCKSSKDTCVAIYRPCSLSEEGCKNNLLFTECRTKSQKNNN